MDYFCERCEMKPRNRTSPWCDYCDKSVCVVCDKLTPNYACTQIQCNCCGNITVRCSAHNCDLVAFWAEYDCDVCAKNLSLVKQLITKDCIVGGALFPDINMLNFHANNWTPFIFVSRKITSGTLPDKMGPDCSHITSDTLQSKTGPDDPYFAKQNVIIKYTTQYGRVFSVKCNDRLEPFGDWLEDKYKMTTMATKREVWRLNAGHELCTKKRIYYKLMTLYRHCANIGVPDDMLRLICAYYRQFKKIGYDH